MRRKLIAANWKMNKTIAQAEAFAAELAGAPGAAGGCDLLVIPPFFAVPAVARALDGTGVAVGAQDIFYEESGAFTGEISGSMIADAGATYALVGHSERRHVIGEDNAIVARKLRAALDCSLTPILCVGELIDEREAGNHEAVVGEQLRVAFGGWSADDAARVVIAYEPVWAIGTGKTATPDDADAMHGFIRGHIRGVFGDVADTIRIQYGGSVKPDNAVSLLGREDIDGALVGGASMEVTSFLGIAAGVPGA
jgi:triosephosphate isomerase